MVFTELTLGSLIGNIVERKILYLLYFLLFLLVF